MAKNRTVPGKRARGRTEGAHGGTPAVVTLREAGVAYSLHPYEHDPAGDLGYGLEAAEATGLPADHVFKTLLTVVDARLVVAIIPVTARLDLKALAKAVGAKKAVLAEPAAAERATGYVVGGISPLGQKQRLPTVLDRAALAVDVVYVSGGRRGLDVGLAPEDLVRLTGAAVAAVART